VLEERGLVLPDPALDEREDLLVRQVLGAMRKAASVVSASATRLARGSGRFSSIGSSAPPPGEIWRSSSSASSMPLQHR